jgi:hypothetical protein
MARSASAGAAGSLSTASSGSDLAPDRPANAASRARVDDLSGGRPAAGGGARAGKEHHGSFGIKGV